MNVDERRATSDAAESRDSPAVEYERNPDETTSEAVVAALSSAMAVPETQLQPIYHAINPDALDSLFHPHSSRGPEDGGQVVFQYDAHRVHVDSDGTVLVY